MTRQTGGDDDDDDEDDDDDDLVSASDDGEAPVVTRDAFDRERLVLVGHHRDRGRRCVTCFWFGFVSVGESKARQDCQKY